MYLNNVVLAGFLGKQAESKYTPNGKLYVRLSLATTASWKGADGEWVNRTDWHQVIAWGKLGESAAKHEKGAHLSVVGQLRYREYDKDGVTHRIAEINADSIRSLDRAAASVPGEPADPDPQPGSPDEVPY